MYNNLPPTNGKNPVATPQNLYSKQFEIDPGTFNMMKGFFQGRGFEKSSAETLSVTIMKQARQDGYNPLEVLDTLKTLDGIQLNTVISDIVNYNRYKTSLIGSSTGFVPFDPVARNIQA